MRIIGGKLRGIKLNPPMGLPTRPTTDRSKEALFNILSNQLNIENIHALDLFSGTGNISLELISRNAASVTAVDINFKCFNFLKETQNKHRLSNLKVVKENVLSFIKRSSQSFDFIFADPPFDLPELSQIPTLIFQYNLLNPGGLLVVEHPSKRKINQHPNFINQRSYGYSSFSFFKERENYIIKKTDMKIAVFPGTFDPITNAHIDIIERAMPLFDKIHIALGVNSKKTHLLSLSQRKEIIQSIFKSEKRIHVDDYEGLTINYCQKINAKYILRGIRSVKDFEFEEPISQNNQILDNTIQTIFLISSPGLSHISSTIVREIYQHSGDIRQLVPKEAIDIMT